MRKGTEDAVAALLVKAGGDGIDEMADALTVEEKAASGVQRWRGCQATNGRDMGTGPERPISADRIKTRSPLFTTAIVQLDSEGSVKKILLDIDNQFA